MAPPEETQTPTSGKVGGAEVLDKATTQNYKTEPTSASVSAPPEVFAEVRSARGSLLRAVFKLDDRGYSCVALDDLNNGAATLLAEWAGRRRPHDRGSVPDWIAEAAIQWRAERDRRARR